MGQTRVDETHVSSNSRPNILFIVTDDQRHDTIHALGNPIIQTPAIDSLIERGTAFINAHIPSGTNGAICIPSRAMILTGKTPFHLENSGISIPKDHVLIGEHLRAHGYSTFGIGKWHNGKDSFNRNHDAGEHIFFGGMADHWNVPLHDFDYLGKYEGHGPFIKDPMHSNNLEFHEYDKMYQGVHSSQVMADAAIKFLQNYASPKPFFLYVAFLAPHDPRTMPRRFLDMYPVDSIPLPPNFLPRHPFETGDLTVRDEKLAALPRRPDEIRGHIRDYYAMISHLDSEIGRIFEELTRRNLWDSTIVILAGDNGLALGQHGLMGKQSCYEHSNRVPLVMAGPSIPANKKTTAFVYLLDIFPTLCDLVGIQQPSSVEGTSFFPALTSESDKARDDLYLAYRSSQRAMKTTQYKLIEYVYKNRHTRTQLFDLLADPWETEDLSGKIQHKPIIDAFRNKMIEYRTQWNELSTTFGQIWWKGFLRSHPELVDDEAREKLKLKRK
jgi:arylsulfatase A-like enzyme